MSPRKPFSKEIIKLHNVESVVKEITEKIRKDIFQTLNRQGAVIGISGGIDSSVCLALASRALGPEKVLGIIIPEKDSSNESEKLALILADKYGVRTVTEEITPALSGLKCYGRRDEAVRQIFPEYDPESYKMKIGVKQTGLFTSLPPMFSLTIIDNTGTKQEQLLPVDEYLKIVAASNLKQRTRMSILYYHAESNHYAVVGTPNKQEQEQGFFVKYGDGGADIMPIGNLYKVQVYQIAEYLGVPEGIIRRTPTTDTYPAEQTQEEFFYQLPLELMDLYWYAFENEYPVSDVAREMNETEDRITALFANFRRKRKTTDYLRMQPVRDYYGV